MQARQHSFICGGSYLNSGMITILAGFFFSEQFILLNEFF